MMNYLRLLAIVLLVICVLFAYFHAEKNVDSNGTTNWNYFFYLYLGGSVIVFFFADTEIRNKYVEMWFAIFFGILIYLIFLFIFNKPLQKYCTAHTCTTIWAVTAISYFYIMGDINSANLMYSKPLLLIPIPHTALKTIAAVWVAGFVVSMSAAIISHLRFSKHISRNAVQITKESEGYAAKLYKYYKECMPEKFNEKLYGLWQTDQIRTPITVGLIDVELYMPMQEYSDEELRWIFQHEFRHLLNRDNQVKFFFAFFKAVFWFIPGLKKTSELVAENIELSCDEAVLRGASEEERRQYTSLILNTGSKPTGFSTCLSSSGESVKYRLSRIMHPVARSSRDIIAIVASVVILVLSLGSIQVSFNYGTAKEMLSINPSSELSISSPDAEIDVDRFKAYLSHATIYENNSAENLDDGFYVDVECDGVEGGLEFGDKVMVYRVFDEGLYLVSEQRYFLKDNSWKEFVKDK